MRVKKSMTSVNSNSNRQLPQQKKKKHQNQHQSTSQKKFQRSSIKILILGDEGVGKSSLISTFVSRHFSNVAPGTMTRVRLPPDPNITGKSKKAIITTIMDSNAIKTDAALMDAIDQDISNIMDHPNNSDEVNQEGATSSGSNGDDASSLTDSMRSFSQTGGDKGGAAGGTNSPSSSESASSFSTHEEEEEEDVGNSNDDTGMKTEASAAVYHHRHQWNTIMNHEHVERNVNFGEGVDHVDSIVLLYDLDRVETFRRLENHWLPLIEQCYHGKLPVIIAGSKLDLFQNSQRTAQNVTDSLKSPPDEGPTMDQSNLSRSSHRQVVALLQRFKFIRQCIKFSAKKLINVDEIFLKAQQAVLYPITPALYDLDQACLADECKRAITRIFRMYDIDNDGLLSNAEVNAFQKHALNVRLGEQDFAGWKKVVSKNSSSSGSGEDVEPVVRDGKFTVAGFMAIFDLFIGQNRLDVAWRMLRTFGYDDDLNLHVPKRIYKPPRSSLRFSASSPGSYRGPSLLDTTSSWALSSSTRLFLASLFHQFDSDHDGSLTQDDLKKIFWVLSGESLPPWHPNRGDDVFKASFSRPASHSKNGPFISDTFSSLKSGSFNSYSTGGITICSAGSVDSNDKIDVHLGPLTFNEWMGHWHMMSAISPGLTRAELYRLGHVEDQSKIGLFRPRERFSPTMPSSAIRIFVVGKNGNGKASFVKHLQASSDGAYASDSNIDIDEKNEEENVFCSLASLTEGAKTSFTWINSQTPMPMTSSEEKQVGEMTDHISYFIVTEIPGIDEDDLRESDAVISELKTQIFGKRGGIRPANCDVVLLVFDHSDPSSLSYVHDIERFVLNDSVPRMFVCTNYDRVNSKKEDLASESTLKKSLNHCKESDLEPPILISLKKDMGHTRLEILQLFCKCMNEHDIRVTPHGEKKRRDAQRKRIIKWFGGFVSTGLVLAISVRFLVNGVKSDTPKEAKSTTSWLPNFSLFGKRS